MRLVATPTWLDLFIHMQLTNFPSGRAVSNIVVRESWVGFYGNLVFWLNEACSYFYLTEIIYSHASDNFSLRSGCLEHCCAGELGWFWSSEGKRLVALLLPWQNLFFYIQVTIPHPSFRNGCLKHRCAGQLGWFWQKELCSYLTASSLALWPSWTKKLIPVCNLTPLTWSTLLSEWK